MTIKIFSGLVASSLIICVTLSPPVVAQRADEIPIKPGKQCVYNKGGYILNVSWYHPMDVVWNGEDDTDFENFQVTGKSDSADTISLGYSSCTNASNRWAVVRIQDYDKVNAGLNIGVGVVAGVASAVGGAVVCVGSAGTACPAVAAAVPLVVGGIASGALLSLPNVEEVVYVGKPSSENYLDFYGTVWDVGVSSDFALTEKRKPITEAAKVVRDFVDGGKPGAKSITFNNQAGYVAEMFVIYFKDQKIGDSIISLPVVKSSGKLSAGFSRHIDIPTNLSDIPINVAIKGTGTLENEVFSSNLPVDFTGNRCFKSWGTIFDTEGGEC